MDNPKVETYHTIVIGGGQAGLAAGYYLAQSGQDFVILEGENRVGESWRRRWDSLRLFTPAKFSHLPGMEFPAAPNDFPTKEETASYLEEYAQRFKLPIQYRTRVDSLSREGDNYWVNTGQQRLQARHVVVATGTFQKASLPEFAGELDPAIQQLHSSQYQNPGQLQEGSALVVGAANSGAEIAIELAASRRVWLSGRDPGRIPIPRNIPGGDKVFWWLISKKFNVDSLPGRKIRAKLLAGGGDPLIGVTNRDVDRAGVKRVPRTAGVREGSPLLEDGRILDVRNVIWATGYRPDYAWIHLPVFSEDGIPVHHRGVVRNEPGLYFLGLRFMYALASPLIGGVGADAEYIANQIAARSAASEASMSKMERVVNSPHSQLAGGG